MAKLAFYTFGILEEPVGHPDSLGFLQRIPSVFEGAEQSDGFVGRAVSRSFDDPDPIWGDPSARPRFTSEQLKSREDSVPEPYDGYDPTTISLWDDLESVYAFAYNGRHMEALKQRDKWFVKPGWPTSVAWWVADGETPTREDAATRLEHLHDEGATPYAFDFKTPFDSEGQPWKIDRAKIQERAKAVKSFDEDNPTGL